MHRRRRHSCKAAPIEGSHGEHHHSSGGTGRCCRRYETALVDERRCCNAPTRRWPPVCDTTTCPRPSRCVATSSVMQCNLACRCSTRATAGELQWSARRRRRSCNGDARRRRGAAMERSTPTAELHWSARRRRRSCNGAASRRLRSCNGARRVPVLHRCACGWLGAASPAPLWGEPIAVKRCCHALGLRCCHAMTGGGNAFARREMTLGRAWCCKRARHGGYDYELVQGRSPELFFRKYANDVS